MKTFLCLLLFGAATTFSAENDNDETANAAKLVEGYVLAADFDNKPVAQVQDIHKPEAKVVNQISFSADENRNPDVYFPRQPDLTSGSGVDRNAIIPSESALIVSQRSLLAVGFLTFLILLNSLQTSMMSMAITRNPAPASTSLLGGVTQALGRRRRRRDVNP